ncbi:hypothetical protein [Streptomyces sp. NPDC018693]|uniref:hypothetical protein n=1 Tax=unclassified Streptomyces TaxID=2593676 RepID=UPI0037AF3A87
MLALRLTRGAHPAVQLRRLLVAAASAGTGFLLLCTLGYALGHPDNANGSLLRLAWCTVPLAATVHLAMAVARTDPGTRPRPGLAAIGLGPNRLMAISATTTALSTLLGSTLALLVFLHLRGDLTGMPFDGAAADFLAADLELPLPAALTLLSLVPLAASLSVALMLRPRDTRLATRAAARTLGRFGAQGKPAGRESFGTYGRFGARQAPTRPNHHPAQRANNTAQPAEPASSHTAALHPTHPADQPAEPAVGAEEPPSQGGSAPTRASALTPTPAPSGGRPKAPPRPNPTALPWGTALLATGLAVEAYAGRSNPSTPLTAPDGLPTGPAAVLLGWALTALGLALAGPGLTHLCGRLLQAARPGALRLLAGRGLMEESTRIGRPLGVVCAVASAAYTMAAVHNTTAPDQVFGPLTTLGTLLVTGCALATLLTAAVEARQARADTTAALLRLGAPTTTLRGAAALRAGALLALFAPLTLVVAELAALPFTQ